MHEASTEKGSLAAWCKDSIEVLEDDVGKELLEQVNVKPDRTEHKLAWDALRTYIDTWSHSWSVPAITSAVYMHSVEQHSNETFIKKFRDPHSKNPSQYVSDISKLVNGNELIQKHIESQQETLLNIIYLLEEIRSLSQYVVHDSARADTHTMDVVPLAELDEGTIPTLGEAMGKIRSMEYMLHKENQFPTTKLYRRIDKDPVTQQETVRMGHPKFFHPIDVNVLLKSPFDKKEPGRMFAYSILNLAEKEKEEYRTARRTWEKPKKVVEVVRIGAEDHSSMARLISHAIGSIALRVGDCLRNATHKYEF